jgi:hypothetical protein
LHYRGVCACWHLHHGTADILSEGELQPIVVIAGFLPCCIPVVSHSLPQIQSWRCNTIGAIYFGVMIRNTQNMTAENENDGKQSKARELKRKGGQLERLRLAFAVECGCKNYRSAPRQVQNVCKALALATVALETLTRKQVSGEPVDLRELGTVVNTEKRARAALAQLKAANAPAKPQPGAALREHFAQKAAEKAAAAQQGEAA